MSEEELRAKIARMIQHIEAGGRDNDDDELLCISETLYDYAGREAFLKECVESLRRLNVTVKELRIIEDGNERIIYKQGGTNNDSDH